MTADQIKAQIAKLNQSQRAALRAKFGGRTISSLNVNDDFITVEFGASVHHFFIGERGGIRHHTIASAK